MSLPRQFLFPHGKIADLPDFVVLGTRQDEEQALLTLSDHERMHMYLCGVTGCGKTRFLESLMVQDIALGKGLCVIDPTGYLFRQAVDFIAACADDARYRGMDEDQVEGIFSRYLFLDLADHGNPLRVNPLEPHEGETTEEVVDDLMKLVERMFGDLDQTRRLRQVLRNTLWVIVELNRLAETQRPTVPDGHSFPLNLRFAAEFLSAMPEQRAIWVDAMPVGTENQYVLVFWKQFFSKFTQSQRMERLESTWNALQYLLGDSLVDRFFGCGKSTFHVPDLLRNRTSLFCSLPLGMNLRGSELIGRFIATKFQRAAYRRAPAERASPYMLYVDEFQHFADEEFASATATLRQFGLRLLLSHQSQEQPPFHTAEGRSVLNTIRANCQTKVVFRLARDDAETLAREMFELTQRRLNFRTEERSVTTGQGTSRTRTVSFQVSRGSTVSWARASSVGWAKTDSVALGFSTGTNIGSTLTRGIGCSIAEGLSRSITLSESEGVTESHSRTKGLSLALGKNWSHLVDHRRGTTLTYGNGESLAVCRGDGVTHTSGQQFGQTETTGGSTTVSQGSQKGSSVSSGSSYRVTDGQGSTFASTGTGITSFHSSAGSSSGGQSGSSLSEMSSVNRSETETYQSAVNMVRSVAEAVSRTSSQTVTRNHNASRAASDSTGVGDTTGGTEVRTTNSSDTVTRGTTRERGRAVTQGQTRTLTSSQQESLAHAFSLLEQVSRTMTRALQETASTTETLGGSTQNTRTEGRAQADGVTTTSSESFIERKIYFSLEGERELSIAALQQLPRRRCVIAKQALGAMEVETLFVPNTWYFERGEGLPEQLLRQQRQRFGVREEDMPVLDLISSGLTLLPKSPEDGCPAPPEDWFPDW